MLKYVILLCLFLPAPVLSNDSTLDYQFLSAAEQFNLPVRLLRAVCWVESNHRDVPTRMDGTTPSYGMCQMKLKTARMMGFQGNAKMLRDPAINIWFAAKYLAYQMQKYTGNWRKAVTAYNRGHYSGTITNHYVVMVALAMADGR